MSATVDKNQRVLLMILPGPVVPFIIRFKTGLVLYWVTTNLWTVGRRPDHAATHARRRRRDAAASCLTDPAS